MSNEDLRKQYPELDDLSLVDVSIIDNGEMLSTINDASKDFVIANHFLEHCQDPINTLHNFLRVLKSGGTLYFSVPDKRYTFDRDRPVTPFEHILKDFNDGPLWSRRAHYIEFADKVNKAVGAKQIEQKANRLMETDYSIHFHTWTIKEMIDIVNKLPEHIEYSFECKMLMHNDTEVIIILSKL